jgi:hypothetical protein
MRWVDRALLIGHPLTWCSHCNDSPYHSIKHHLSKMFMTHMSLPDGKFRNRLRPVIGTSIPTSFHVEVTWICLRHVKHNFKFDFSSSKVVLFGFSPTEQKSNRTGTAAAAAAARTPRVGRRSSPRRRPHIARPFGSDFCWTIFGCPTMSTAAPATRKDAYNHGTCETPAKFYCLDDVVSRSRV